MRYKWTDQHANIIYYLYGCYKRVPVYCTGGGGASGRGPAVGVRWRVRESVPGPVLPLQGSLALPP